MAMELIEQFEGCLLGLAVGDALGGPVEFMTPEDISGRYGRLTEMVGGGWLNLQPGEYTDDTQMMLAIAESIVECGDVDPADIAKRFVAWYDTGPKDIGSLTLAAMQLLKQGESWHRAGKIAYERSGGAGNGSVMRCAPVGLFRYRDPVKLLADSISTSQITHYDKRACFGTVVVNHFIASFLSGEQRKLPGYILSELAEFNSDLFLALAELPRLELSDLKPTGFVVDTVQAALWCFAFTDSFEEAVTTAVNLGGDADTLGAVCGAVAGAYYGCGAIPGRWLERLHGRAHIAELAAGILERTK